MKHKIELVCEACGEVTSRLIITPKKFFYCEVCDVARKRRERFLAEEKDWESLTTDSKGPDREIE